MDDIFITEVDANICYIIATLFTFLQEGCRKARLGKGDDRSKQGLLLLSKCCFTSTETVGLLGTGAQDGHLDFHTAPQ